MRLWLQRQWYGQGLWHLLLVPLSWLFRLLSSLRHLGYRLGLLPSSRLAVPVIVIGNISVGGTGKTPLVIWLADRLKKAGYRPGIISRGYGGAKHLLAVTADSNPDLVGDEPVMLARRTQCPVWVGQDRVATAHALTSSHADCDVLISDDGLQHYRLQRTVEVAVIDGRRRFGNGWLLPAGPLREPISRLECVDFVVNNGGKAAGQEFSMQLESRTFQNVAAPERTATPASFAGLDVHAIAGIGHPNRFFQQLRDLGLQFEQTAFADHYPFKPADLQAIHAQAILMTEKDAVKCAAFAQPHWWYLPVDAVVDESLAARILEKLRK